MDEAAAQRRLRVNSLLHAALQDLDPNAEVISGERPDGKIEFRIVSQLFAGKDSREREAILWPAFNLVPDTDLLHLTYCLFLTPDEAREHFSAADRRQAGEDWDEELDP